MADTKIYVKNLSGQVTGFNVSGPGGQAREVVLRQRIMRGELTEVKSGEKSGQANGHLNPAVEDIYTGVRDEKGDLLRSVHGGGIDPDAKGDALGQPSGSEFVDGMVKAPENAKVPIGDSHPAAAVDAPNDASALPDDPSTGGKPTPQAKSK